jgi:hypothetical protein
LEPIDRDPGVSAGWCVAALVAQQGVGLCPAGAHCCHAADSPAHLNHALPRGFIPGCRGRSREERLRTLASSPASPNQLKALALAF